MNDTAVSTSASGTPGLVRRIPWRSVGIIIPFVAVFVALSIGSPSFLTPLNLENLLNRQSGILIIAVASTLVLIAGGIDLSVGATYMLASVVAADLVISTGPVAGVLAAIGVGLVVGLLNGVISTYLRINPLIATLAMSFIISGITMLVARGRLLNLTGAEYDGFKRIAQTRSEEHTSELPSLMSISYALFSLKKK